jgi:hypothetical protein
LQSLTDNELNLIPLFNSNVHFNYGKGSLQTSWIGNNEAFVVYDYDHTGNVDQSSKIVLTKWSKENANTDFKGLLELFDTNNDKVFDSNDKEFCCFLL